MPCIQAADQFHMMRVRSSARPPNSLLRLLSCLLALLFQIVAVALSCLTFCLAQLGLVMAPTSTQRRRGARPAAPRRAPTAAAAPARAAQEEPHSEDDGNMYIDRTGRCYCSAHRKAMCHVCCVDHRPTNDIVAAGADADIDAIMDKHGRIQDAEHRAMGMQQRMEGGDSTLMLGTPEAQRLYDVAAAAPPSGADVCAHCGKGGQLKRCTRCWATQYCSREHQRAHYQAHKAECRRKAAELAAAGTAGPHSAAAAQTAAGAAGAADAGAGQGSSATTSDGTQPEVRGQLPITWAQLEALRGMPATNKVLELRIVSQPIPFLRHVCEVKDRKNDVRRLAFYSDAVPPGLALGKVLRWRDPQFHQFIDGSSGGRIEDEDVPNITVSDQ